MLPRRGHSAITASTCVPIQAIKNCPTIFIKDTNKCPITQRHVINRTVAPYVKQTRLHNIQNLKEIPKSKQARDSIFKKFAHHSPFPDLSLRQRHIQSLLIAYTPPHLLLQRTLPLPPRLAMPTSDNDFDLSVRSLFLALSFSLPVCIS